MMHTHTSTLYYLSSTSVIFHTTDCYITKLIKSISSMNVLWISNCRGYNKPMTSHALGGLAGSRRRCCMQQKVGRCQGCHLESTTSYHKFNSGSWCVLTWRTILPNFIPIWYEGFYWTASPLTDIFVTWPCSSWTLHHDNWHSFIIIIIIKKKNNRNNKMRTLSRGTGSVSDSKTHDTTCCPEWIQQRRSKNNY